MRPTKAIINLSNLRENYLNIRKQTTPAKVIPVIKAEAYGHGAVEVAKALLQTEHPPELFAVAMCDEAVQLREAGITTPILVFEEFCHNTLFTYLQHSFIPTIADEAGVRLVNHLPEKTRMAMQFAVKVDTGMGRIGLTPEDAIEAIKSFTLNGFIHIHSVYTHLATSDEEDLSFAHLQIDRYNSLIQELKNRGYNYGFTHFSNSGGIHNLDQQGADFVRAGISLYGYYPSKFCNKKIPLKPVMSLVSEVATIRYFSAGETISYGRKYLVTEPSLIASIPIGYADGVPRCLSGKIVVKIKDKIYPQIGTITMDRIMINCGNDPIAKSDVVTLFGEEGITADTWAELADTISYEITCGISKRVPRKYI